MFRPSKNRRNCFLQGILSISVSSGLWLAGLGLGSWLLHVTIAPSPVQAATKRETITITRQFSETYQSMLRRAEAEVRAAAQRIFDQNLLITDITVNALGQNGGAITPMFTLEVSRSNWRTSPNPERWANYYSDAQSLLNLAPRTATTPATPVTTPVTAPASPALPSPGTRPVVNPTPLNSRPANRPVEEELVIF